MGKLILHTLSKRPLLLRNSLLEHLKSVTTTTDNVIRMQLCLAMADLILLMPEWNNAVHELMQKLADASQVYDLYFMLTISVVDPDWSNPDPDPGWP